MQNDASDAKLGADPRSTCTIEDIYLVENATNYWTVTEDGEADSLNDTVYTDFVEYKCDGCYSSFDSFEDVKEHLDEKI